MRSGIFLAIVVGATNAASADTIHVPGDYPTIQAAILAALEGDEIIVAPGTYNEAIFFNGHNITLRSEFGPEVTTIDASGFNNSVVRIILGEGPATTLDGFTITGGLAEFGGGIYCDGSDPTIQDCIITTNTATNTSQGGGGMYARDSTVTVLGCRFVNNAASQGGAGGGGGVFCSTGSNVSFVGCEFIGNTGYWGGAIHCVASSIDLTWCLLEQNEANVNNGQGGGVYSNSTSDVSLAYCSILNNSAVFGGGVRLVTGTSSFTNCLFAGNTGEGAGLFVVGGFHELTNCTISGNSGPRGGGGIQAQDALGLVIDNCVMWGNTPNSLFGNGVIEVSYSNIELGWPGCDFCILADPLFVDPASGDYRLAAGSPCIDLGNNAAVPKGIDTDLDGAPRFVDDPDTPDCPQPGADCGSAPIVDMGAYEFQPILCPWDLDDTGDVGVKDLLVLLGNWGPCPPKGDCLADFDNTGDVGVKDLLLLLGNWGPCP